MCSVLGTLESSGLEDDSHSEHSEDDGPGVVLFRKRRRNGDVASSTRSANEQNLVKGRELLDEATRTDDEKLGSWSFESLGLSPWLVATCRKLGMNEATPVQRACIPPTLKGLNVVGGSPTGSGKTAAFMLPILENLAKDMFGIFAIVLTPTRELAFQIGDQFQAFGVPIRLRCEVIVGGMNRIVQQKALAQRPHVVIATPGRLFEFLSGPMPVKTDKIRFLVLDEADRLLDQSFSTQVGAVLRSLPKERQTLLFTATISSAISKVTSSSTKPVFEYDAAPKPKVPDELEQRYLLVPLEIKLVYLAFILRRFGSDSISQLLSRVSRKKKKRKKLDCIGNDTRLTSDCPEEDGAKKGNESDDDFDVEQADLVAVFTSSCKMCQLVGETLAQLGLQSSVLHGQLDQKHRLAALGQFRSGVHKVLVCTDVASRGLDIPKVGLVVNFDIPKTAEDYVHRVGRTARAGRKGLAISLVSQYELDLFYAIEAYIESKLRLLPDVDEEKDVHVLLTRVKNASRAARMRLVDLHDVDRNKRFVRKRCN